jgi:hypothetical protein
MSTPQSGHGDLPIFVPGYLVLFGLGLIGAAVYLVIALPDELFVAGMALLGGLTMLISGIAVVTWGRRG